MKAARSFKQVTLTPGSSSVLFACAHSNERSFGDRLPFVSLPVAAMIGTSGYGTNWQSQEVALR